MRRIFAGIKTEPDRNFKKLLSDLKDQLSGETIKWTEPGNMHLTLAFLGNTSDDKLPAISRIIREKCEGRGSFEISLMGFGVFKNIKDPKVFWAGMDPNDRLDSLQADIASGLISGGYFREDKPFSPHITIGRIKKLQDTDNLKVLMLKYHGTDIQKVPVSEVILYESILKQDGPLYRALEKFGL